MEFISKIIDQDKKINREIELDNELQKALSLNIKEEDINYDGNFKRYLGLLDKELISLIFYDIKNFFNQNSDMNDIILSFINSDIPYDYLKLTDFIENSGKSWEALHKYRECIYDCIKKNLTEGYNFKAMGSDKRGSDIDITIFKNHINTVLYLCIGFGYYIKLLIGKNIEMDDKDYEYYIRNYLQYFQDIFDVVPYSTNGVIMADKNSITANDYFMSTNLTNKMLKIIDEDEYTYKFQVIHNPKCIGQRLLYLLEVYLSINRLKDERNKLHGKIIDFKSLLKNVCNNIKLPLKTPYDKRGNDLSDEYMMYEYLIDINNKKSNLMRIEFDKQNALKNMKNNKKNASNNMRDNKMKNLKIQLYATEQSNTMERFLIKYNMFNIPQILNILRKDLEKNNLSKGEIKKIIDEKKNILIEINDKHYNKYCQAVYIWEYNQIKGNIATPESAYFVQTFVSTVLFGQNKMIYQLEMTPDSLWISLCENYYSILHNNDLRKKYKYTQRAISIIYLLTGECKKFITKKNNTFSYNIFEPKFGKEYYSNKWYLEDNIEECLRDFKQGICESYKKENKPLSFSHENPFRDDITTKINKVLSFIDDNLFTTFLPIRLKFLNKCN